MLRAVPICATTLLLTAPMCMACLRSADPRAVQKDIDVDLAVQVDLVKRLAAEADTVLIAFAEKDDFWHRHRILFKIQRVVRGQMPPSGEASYMWRPGSAMYCRESEAFLDTNPLPGYTYILYAKNGTLLRAGHVARGAATIPLQQEIQLVAANPQHLTVRSSGP